HQWRFITWSERKQFFVAWDARDSMTARIECSPKEFGGCGARMFEPERRAMLSLGQWRPTAEAKERGLAGFHIPTMLSMFPSVTLPYLVEKWFSANVAGKEA